MASHWNEIRRYFAPHGLVLGTQRRDETTCVRMYLVHDGTILDAGHAEHACGKPRPNTTDGNQITVEAPDIKTVAGQVGWAKW